MSAFAFTFLVFVACLYGPGYMVARALGVPRTWAVCTAPPATLGLVVVLCQLYSFASIPSMPVTVLGSIVLVSLVAILLLRKHAHPWQLPELSPLALLAAVLIGVAAGYILFVSSLPTYDYVFQMSDTAFHVNLIRTYANSGNMTLFTTDAYLDNPAIRTMPPTGFYPAAWHQLCALVVQATGASVTTVINVSSFAAPACIYPLAMTAFVALAFDGDKKYVLGSTLVVLGFVAFPWILIIFGPVYPNLIGFATIPAAMWLFVHGIAAHITVSERIRTIALFLMCVLGQLFLHPNTLFTAVLILTPYGAFYIWNELLKADKGKRIALLAAGAFVLFCCVFWYGCYKMPFFAGIVNFSGWGRYVHHLQGLINILLLDYTFSGSYEYAPEYIVGAFVLIGFVKALHTREYRWMAASYFLACLLIFVSATTDLSIKALLTGFWYQDPNRLAANAAIAGVPLATLGLSWVYDRLLELVDAYNQKHTTRKTNRLKVAAVFSVVFLTLCFFPNFKLPGEYRDYDTLTGGVPVGTEGLTPTDEPAITGYQAQRIKALKNVHTAFGDYRDLVDIAASDYRPLGQKEEIFLQKVKAYVPDDAVIINNPLDGSFFAYGMYNLNIYYRSFASFGIGESNEGRIIRAGLCNIAKDDEVKAAVKNIGAKYVLVMDDSTTGATFVNARGTWHPSAVLGITTINENTPGFEEVLRQGVCRLYKIVE